MTHSLPQWVQIAWFVASFTVAIGAGIWILFFFAPYLFWSKRIMSESLMLAKKTAEMINKIQSELAPIIEDLRDVVHRTRELMPDKDQRDRLILALEKIPTKIDELTKKAESRGVNEIIDKL